MPLGSHLFGRTPGARPAVLGGLINGVAIGAPLLVGAAAGEPAAGATACLGAYVAAFTNKGGERWRRTLGLAVTASINTAAFAAGAVTTGALAVGIVVFAALVFVAGMGAAFGGTAVRSGTMPATAFLMGVFAPQDNVATSIGLVAAGGLWYALATMVLTPTPRLRHLLAPIGVTYREVAAAMSAEADGRHQDRSAVNTALQQADDSVRVLAGPGGDDATAQVARTLVDGAGALVDSISGLRSAGEPDAAIAVEYRELGLSIASRLDTVADRLAARSPQNTVQSDAARQQFVDACGRLRQAAIAGDIGYPRIAPVAHLRRRMLAIDAAVDRMSEQATELAASPNTPVPVAGSPPSRVTVAGLRSAMRLNTTTYRHALRATAVTSLLFAVVAVAHLDHGEWAALAALRVLRPQYGATTHRAWQRVVGNVVGGSCAAVAIALIHSPAALAALVFVIICIGFAVRPVNYAFWVLFGTPLILLIGDIADPGDWHAAVGRIVMTIIGTAAAVVGYFVFFPDWDARRLPGHIARATTETAGYLDAVLRHVAETSAESRADLDTARRVATTSVRTAEESLARSDREPGRADVSSAAAIVDDVTTIVDRLAVLSSLPDVRSSPIPKLAEYRRHAVAAIMGPEPVVDAVALESAVQRMREYVADLHQRREVELRARPDGDTRLRAALRENEPVIEELIRIADRIVALSHAAAARSDQ